MELVQVHFVHHPAQLYWSKTEMSCWVDASLKLKPGYRVKFEHDEREWEVRHVYKTKLESRAIDMKWGLQLPKSQRTEK